MIRSSFFRLVACAAIMLSLSPALLPSAAAEPLFPQTAGVVSYTYREQFKKDVPGTLDLIHKLGIRDIEFSDLFGKTAAEMRVMIDARQIKCSSFGCSYADLGSKTGQIAETAKTLGARFVRVAWIPHQAPFTQAKADEVIAYFNEHGRTLREKHGLTYCYHNHGYEFVPHPAAGAKATLFDYIVTRTRPEDVSFELDILWAHFPGADPAALIEKYPTRIRLLHLKDLKKGVTGDLTGKTPVENDVALGTGQINLPAVLSAALKAKVEHYYIEDESPKVIEQVPQSLSYLKGLVKPQL
jgi:sugar phosphate isomerase/epimerase